MAQTKRNPAVLAAAGLERKRSSAEADSPRVKLSHEFNQAPRYHVLILVSSTEELIKAIAEARR